MKILAKIKKSHLLLGILFTMLLIGIVYAATSYQVNSGATSTIDEWSVCQKVTNNNALAIFVPTNTEAEWTAFRTYASGVSLAECGYYCDNDGDGHYTTTTYSSCKGSSRVSPAGDDCCDSDNRAYPGETTYYSSTNNCGSWDYDCSGTTNKSGCTVRSVSASDGYTCYWDGCITSRGACYCDCTEGASTELNCGQSGYWSTCYSLTNDCACLSDICSPPGCCPPCHMMSSSPRNCVCK